MQWCSPSCASAPQSLRMGYPDRWDLGALKAGLNLTSLDRSGNLRSKLRDGSPSWRKSWGALFPWRKIKGYWISGLYSPWMSWSDLIEEKGNSDRAADQGNTRSLNSPAVNDSQMCDSFRSPRYLGRLC